MKDLKVMCFFGLVNLDDCEFLNVDVFDVIWDLVEVCKYLGFGWGIYICIGVFFVCLEVWIVLIVFLIKLFGFCLSG